jgi:competence protein ComEC
MLADNKNSIALKLLSLSIAALLSGLFWYIGLSEDHHGLLTIDFLDIGQGDAIYIQAPNGNDMLIDGGPGRALLGELGKVTPFYKRSVGAIMVTNPDADHYSGFIDLLDRYKVGMDFEAGTISPTPTRKAFEQKAEDLHVPVVLARRGMKIVLDEKDGVYLSILFPDRDVSAFKTNDGSIVAKLIYGSTSVMLQGDSPQKIEQYLIKLDGPNLKATILKAGHHGSKTATSPEYVQVVSPTWAIISAGLNNRYGFPHKETIDTLNTFHVNILKTMGQGSIIFQSDGKEFKQK